ncbi:hypothetical protein KCU91_g4694, partial [Aureobasidium melanogenum]
MSLNIDRLADEDRRPEPFAIGTSRLILLPSYLAIGNPAYRDLYSLLHGMTKFTTMAFGPDWGIRHWDDKAITSIIQREIDASWRVRGIGDFAVGLRQDTAVTSSEKTATSQDLKVLDMCKAQELEDVEWIGYVGVRDATTTSMPWAETHHPTLRPWIQMVELRYGFRPEVWGKGYGSEAAKAVMWWCEKHIGAQRFVAETEIANVGSSRILRKSGFEEIREDEEVIWGLKGKKEWEQWAASVPHPERGPIIQPDF